MKISFNAIDKEYPIEIVIGTPGCITHLTEEIPKYALQLFKGCKRVGNKP